MTGSTPDTRAFAGITVLDVSRILASPFTSGQLGFLGANVIKVESAEGDWLRNAAPALPGSPMYHPARKNGWALPDSYEGYAFLSYESQPLPTKYLTSAEVLRFRDDAWQKYFTHGPYLDLVERRFGMQERKNVVDMSQIRLKRKILGD